jgi:hypothetical protein
MCVPWLTAGFRNAAKRSGDAGHVGFELRRSYEGQLSILDARCDVAACVAAMSDAERQRQSRHQTTHASLLSVERDP